MGPSSQAVGELPPASEPEAGWEDSQGISCRRPRTAASPPSWAGTRREAPEPGTRILPRPRPRHPWDNRPGRPATRPSGSGRSGGTRRSGPCCRSGMRPRAAWRKCSSRCAGAWPARAPLRPAAARAGGARPAARPAARQRSRRGLPPPPPASRKSAGPQPAGAGFRPAVPPGSGDVRHRRAAARWRPSRGGAAAPTPPRAAPGRTTPSASRPRRRVHCRTAREQICGRACARRGPSHRTACPPGLRDPARPASAAARPSRAPPPARRAALLPSYPHLVPSCPLAASRCAETLGRPLSDRRGPLPYAATRF